MKLLFRSVWICAEVRQKSVYYNIKIKHNIKLSSISTDTVIMT